MAAITTTRQLRLRPIVPLPHSSLHHFSSSSSPNPDTSESVNSNNTRPSFSSYFSDVKATLQNNKPNPTTVASLEEIRKNLSEFRARSPPPAAPSSSTGKHVTLQELYNRNLISNSDNSNPKAPSFDAIRDSLRHLRSNPNPNSAPSKIQKQFDSTSIQRFKETMKLKAEDLDPGTVNGGSRGLNFGGGDGVAMRTEFVKMYDTKELGTKLRMLRPERRKGKWFSLCELNERLVRLREMEERESQGMVGGVTFKDLRETLVKLKISDDEKVKKKTLQRLSVLGQLGGTPDYLLSPPQDNLVDKYFHPDNMSSAEKLKLELKKVRDEFKMSESDCGSARVQVAQLTTKIKHLSTVLQKKDKHSRKGLQAMVQRRKKLLKYLRRTDWDSYCLVLSKLGLRDNPDIKA